MRVLMLGLNHRTADVAIREQAALNASALSSQCLLLREQFPGCECVVVSTCNRCEVYIARPPHAPPDVQQLRLWWSQHKGVSLEALSAATLHREQEPAVSHLFRVTCGLDSMVVGEAEILGQVRRAYESACEADTAGPVLHGLFQRAIAVSREVRGQTGLSREAGSVGSVAVRFAQSVFESFEDKTVAAIGAGEMGKVVLRKLLRQSPRQTWIVNRTAARATALAEALSLTVDQGGPRSWDDLGEVLVEADVVVTATGACEPVITQAMLRPLVKRRRNRPLFMLDLAVPRDVEPAVGSLPNVYLYNVDDLRSAIEDDPARRAMFDACELRIAQEASASMHQIQHRDVGQLIRSLRSKLYEIAQQEYDRSRRKLQAMPMNGHADTLEQLLEEHSHRLINKVLHLPVSQLNKPACEGEHEPPLGFYAAALRRLFDLHESEAASNSYAAHDPHE
jgi:glutamyl-tRNA reductase